MPAPHDDRAGWRSGRRRAVLAAAAVALAGACGTSPRGAAHHPTTSRPVAPAVTVSLGPDGVRSSAVAAENARPGTSAWQITGTPPAFIEGFADHNYAEAGDEVGLYVSTSAASFTVTAYRMGYYQGLGARQVWRSAPVAGTAQPACPLDTATNTVACDNWSRSLTVTVTSAWPSGDYLLKLVGSGGQEAYVPLTVWDPTSHAAYVVMARSLTEEGWNTYGGFDYYQGTGPCIVDQDSYPVCNRARAVSFDRPFAEDFGASDFLSNEYPLVRYVEQQGLDVTYVTDVTVNDHPDLLLDHRALLSLGHDETWTYPERQGAVTAFDHGVNLVFFGAASVLRHSRLEPSPLGPDRLEVDYRNAAEDPLQPADPTEITGNTWSSPPTDLPEWGLVGQIYAGYILPGKPAAPLVVTDPSAWIFKGTGLGQGQAVPGVISSDIDHLDPAEQMPTDIEVLAHSPVPLADAYTNQGQWAGNTYSDMTYYSSAQSGAGVFDSGNVGFIAAMGPCPASGPCPAPVLDRITGNLLWLFGQGPAGKVLPSTPNWQSVIPAGS